MKKSKHHGRIQPAWWAEEAIKKRLPKQGTFKGQLTWRKGPDCPENCQQKAKVRQSWSPTQRRTAGPKVAMGSQRKTRSGLRATRWSGPASGREGCGRNRSSGYDSRRRDMMVHPETTSQQWKGKVFQRLTRKD